jgi:predicted anti-sigma-YlaC factor YlaD
MNCKRAQSRLVAFEEGQLSAGDQELVHGHLQHCFSCRKLLQELGRLHIYPFASVTDAQSQQFHEQLEHAIEMEWASPAPKKNADARSFQSARSVFAIASAVTLLIGTSAIFYFSNVTTEPNISAVQTNTMNNSNIRDSVQLPAAIVVPTDHWF